MTLLDALNRIDEVNPSGVSQGLKIKWISTLDGLIKTEIIDRYEGAESIVFHGYTEEDIGEDKDLLVPPPYDDIYIRWLEAMIDYTNGEYKKYNNSLTAYNDSYSLYARFYNRTHKSKSQGGFKF